MPNIFVKDFTGKLIFSKIEIHEHALFVVVDISLGADGLKKSDHISVYHREFSFENDEFQTANATLFDQIKTGAASIQGANAANLIFGHLGIHFVDKFIVSQYSDASGNDNSPRYKKDAKFDSIMTNQATLIDEIIEAVLALIATEDKLFSQLQQQLSGV